MEVEREGDRGGEEGEAAEAPPEPTPPPIPVVAGSPGTPQVPEGAPLTPEQAQAAVALINERLAAAGIRQAKAAIAQGAVVLEGLVEDDAERARAEEIARGVLSPSCGYSVPEPAWVRGRR